MKTYIAQVDGKTYRCKSWCIASAALYLEAIYGIKVECPQVKEEVYTTDPNGTATLSYHSNSNIEALAAHVAADPNASAEAKALADTAVAALRGYEAELAALGKSYYELQKELEAQ